MTTTKTPHAWGYEHPDVIGPNALMFFTWDLSKTIEDAFRQANSNNIEEYIEQAQSLINELLQRYVDLKADPEAFEGQSITLALEESESEVAGFLLRLQTSTPLEDKLIAMQNRTPTGHS